MLDILNQAIKEYGIKNDPDTVKMADKVKNTPGMKDSEKKQIIGALVSKENVDEGVEALIHPDPLPLVGVDHHGEEVVADLVDDDRDHAVLFTL